MDEFDQFNVPDCDACSPQELHSLFPKRFIPVHSTNVVKSNKNELTGLLAENGESTVALHHTDSTVSLLNRVVLKVGNSYCPHEKDTTCMKFSPGNSKLLFTSSLDGTMKLYDLRSNKVEKTISMKGSERKCPVTTFDVSPNERIICAGTERLAGDSYLLFWDIRGDKLLGSYWECHSDDITTVNFSPTNSNTVASGSTDHLLNVYDLYQTNEDDALTYSLNLEETTKALYWSTYSKKKNILALTDVLSVQFWDIEESKPTCKFNRGEFTKALKRKAMYECYIIPIEAKKVGKDPLILGGSGLEHGGTNCLRAVQLNEKKGILEPYGLFVQDCNKLDSITNGALHFEDSDNFLTTTESGDVTIWHNKEPQTNEILKASKVKNKIKKGPY